MRSEMKCDDAFEAMSAGLDGELGDTERPRLRHHLQGCDRCRTRDAELRAVHRQMRASTRAAALRPPERLRARIERDCTPVRWRVSPFNFSILLTGAGALGALLALALRPSPPAAEGSRAADVPSPRDRQGSDHGDRTLSPAPAVAAPAAVGTPGDIPPAAAAVATGELPTGAAVAPGPVALASPPPATTPQPPAPVPAPSAPPPAAPNRPAAATAAGTCPAIPDPMLVQLQNEAAPSSHLPPVRAELGLCGLDPPVLSVRAGQTVELFNPGTTRQVALDVPAGGERQTLAPGARATHRYDRPGVYPVWCDGASPCGYVVVAAHAQHAVVAERGKGGVEVQFPAAAPGPHAAEVFLPQKPPLAATVEVTPAGAALVNLAGQPGQTDSDRVDPSAGVLLASALSLNGCRLVRDRQSPVAHACQRGGVREAKRAMKRLINQARRNGLRFECDSCHRNEDDWTLTEDARANFNRMLAAAGT